jgi:FixJ family two-component response regulator
MTKASPRVALVDDDAAVRKALARLLSASSFDISTFASAREFLDSLTEDHPACLVLDLHMPEITGIELQRMLVGAGIHIPTILITGHNEPGLSERCCSAGAVAFLVKPVEWHTLVGEINAAIGRPYVKDRPKTRVT